MNKFRALAALLLFCAGLGWGADFTWIGADGDPWEDPSNWFSSPPLSGFPGWDGTIARNNTAEFPSTAIVSLPALIASGNLGKVEIQLNSLATLTLNGSSSSTELHLPEITVTKGFDTLTIEGTL